MTHFYVVNGNEYGIDITTKRNFIDVESAKAHFDETKFDDFGCMLVFVDCNGLEEILIKYHN